MKVAVLFSGGKDSSLAVKYCLDHNWDVTLIAVQPKNTEAYIWHYPAVGMTELSAKAMNLPIIHVSTDEIGNEEAACLNGVFEKNRFDAVVLGGVGLQETQIREVKKVADKFGIRTIVPYAGWKSEDLLLEEIASGLDIMITEVAAGGLTKDLIGKRIDNNSFLSIKELSEKFGFDILGEGGAYNTLVTDAPFFSKKISVLDYDSVWDDRTRSGYMDIRAAKFLEK